MHIVVLTGSYYPYMAPPVACLSPYLLDLANDNEVEVICPKYNDNYNEHFIKNNIRINFISSFPNNVLSYVRTNNQEGGKRWLSKVLDVFYRGGRYIKYLIQKEAYETSLISQYVNKVEQIEKINKIDVLISISFPFYTHAAALRIKQKHPIIKWVTYTTDPLAYSHGNPLESFKKREAINIEQNVYDSCNYCIVTEELYPNLIDDYKIPDSKILKLPFLLSPIPIKDYSNENKRIQVLYAGYVYYKIRNPQLMLDVFSGIDDVDLNLYIAGDRFCRRQLKNKFPDNIHINGLVSRDSYFQLLSQSDVLINLSNSIPLQAPSKLLELVSTGKAIINFYFDKNTGYRIIDRYPLGLNVPTSCKVEEIRELVDSFVTENKNKRLNYCQIKELYPEHLLETHLPKVRDIVLG